MYRIDKLYWDYFLTEIDVYSELNIWNDDSSNWNTNLEQDEDQSYTGYFDLTDAYISSTNEIKLQLLTDPETYDFDILIDQLMVTYSTRIKKEL